eukprot:256342-Chlamydomonas_euryale.AAC.2
MTSRHDITERAKAKQNAFKGQTHSRTHSHGEVHGQEARVEVQAEEAIKDVRQGRGQWRDTGTGKKTNAMGQCRWCGPGTNMGQS